jgi:signal transduction histidine kinase
MRRPLDRLPSLKAKLSVVIVAAVGVTASLVVIGARSGLPLVLCGVLAVLIALAMVQFLARGLTAPLRQMALASDEMSRGHYGLRVETSAKDEIGQLARSFNEMASDLEEVDRERRDLIANVSHELRTPISALRAVLENIVDGVEPADPEKLRLMVAQVDRLGRLVSQLLDLSRLESSAVPFERRRFEVQPLLQAVIDEASLDPERQPRIRLAVEPEGLHAEGDPERIHQVLANLLDNALRHSPANGEVVLSARPGPRGVLLSVSDEGPGIPASEADRVFERFYRSASAKARDGGTGLGLAIARWIVDLHGGEIRAERRRPRGCRIVFGLPSAPR